MVNFSPTVRWVLVTLAVVLAALSTVLPSPWQLVDAALVTALAGVGIVPPHVEAK